MLGRFGKAGHGFKEFSSIHQMDCRNPDEIYVAEITAYRVQKVILKPQTTRTVVRGIVHREDAQLVLVDTPGLHRPRTLLGQRLNDVVRATLNGLLAMNTPAEIAAKRGKKVEEILA